MDVLIANRHGIFGVGADRAVQEFAKFYAFGYGCEYALGAMFAAYEDPARSAEDVARLGVEAAAEPHHVLDAVEDPQFTVLATRHEQVKAVAAEVDGGVGVAAFRTVHAGASLACRLASCAVARCYLYLKFRSSISLSKSLGLPEASSISFRKYVSLKFQLSWNA